LLINGEFIVDSVKFVHQREQLFHQLVKERAETAILAKIWVLFSIQAASQ